MHIIGGTCVLLFALWMVVDSVDEPHNHHGLTRKRSSHQTTSHKFPRPGHAKPIYPKPSRPHKKPKMPQPGNRLPNKHARPHHKQHLIDINNTERHRGFAIMGQSYYKGQFVKCRPKQTLVCITDKCKVKSCSDILANKDVKTCPSGPDSHGCQQPVVCDCDNDNGYVRTSESNDTCVRQTHCFTTGVAPSELRCPYTGCNDNATCANAWLSTPPPCDESHTLENCTEPGQRCPMHYFRNEKGHCVTRDHCWSCDKNINEVPVCPSVKCQELTCDNVWKLRKPDATRCVREEQFPSCTSPPVCSCNPIFDYVRYDSTDGKSAGVCDLKAGCVICKPNEFPYCPDRDKSCKERTYDDVLNGVDTTPCVNLGDYSKCSEKPKCHCIYPYIRKDGECILATKIFNKCNLDDTLTPVCLNNGCSLRTCQNKTPEKKCHGKIGDLYNCSMNGLFCQCTKGDVIYNVDEASDKCATEAECAKIYTGSDEDYDL